jgi:hypothetical protein
MPVRHVTRRLLSAARGAGLEVMEKTPDRVYLGAIEPVLRDGKVVAVRFAGGASNEPKSSR